MEIQDLLNLSGIKKITGFEGAISFDSSKPDGTPRKVLDVSLIKSIGWQPTISLEEGLTAVAEHIKNSPELLKV